MNRFWKVATVALLVQTMGVLFFSPHACAQTDSPTPKNTDAPQSNETSTDEGWHVGISPYMWFAGIHGTTGVLGHDASVHASFSEIFEYFNIGAMGAVETRYNRVLMPLDFMWMKLSDNKALPLNEVAESVKAGMTETMLTPKIGYRVADGKKMKVDALFGIRYWHVSTTFTLQPTQIGNGFSQSASWVDAVAGGRITTILSRKAFATVLGDAGGGGAHSDYQIGGFLGYQISRRWVLLGGYRYLSVDYRPNGKAQFVYDVDMPGLVIGATFNAK
jgi:hypothetical protein